MKIARVTVNNLISILTLLIFIAKIQMIENQIESVNMISIGRMKAISVCSIYYRQSKSLIRNLSSSWLRCLWSLVKVTTLMKIIVCISRCFWILKLCHFEQLCVIFLLHFVEILTMRVIMSHSTGTSVSSRKLVY